MKTVLVTGGAGGIGSEISKKFALKGYNVIAAFNTSLENAGHLQNEFNISVVRADVAKMSGVSEIADFVSRKSGGVDILVNNAGISSVKLVSDISEAEYDEIMSVNLKSAFFLSKALLPYMIHKKQGRIINISSIWGLTGASCEVVYSMSKAGLIGFTKALAKELAPSGITVNAVAPGVIETSMMSGFSQEEIKEITEEIPLGRMGLPQEIAEAVYFLASDKASYITGQVLSPNGGIVI